jgi:hypothetical protein
MSFEELFFSPVVFGNFEPVVIVQVMIHIHYYSVFQEKFRENFSFFSQRQDYIIVVAHGSVP